MIKRKSYEFRLKILEVLSKNKQLSVTKLQTKLNTNYNSVKNNCKELEVYGFIETKVIDKHPENGRKSYQLQITNEGLKVLEKAKKYKDRF